MARTDKTTVTGELNMPILRIDTKKMTTEIIWQYDEWCQRLPKWWLKPCSCQRTCHLQQFCNHVWDNLSPTICKHLVKYGIVTLEGWVVKKTDKSTVTLYPWPKKLYRVLW